MSHILIVDDDDQVRRLLQRSLEGKYQITAAASADEAEKKLSSGISLIITDIVMPDRTGVEAIPVFKRKCPGAKILAISGGSRKLSSSFSLESAQMQGADAVLSKPFDLQQLRQQVEALLA